MRLEFLRTYRGPGADDDEAEAWHEHHVASLKTTREAVLAFMNDGQCPHGDAGFQALALFLLNKDFQMRCRGSCFSPAPEDSI